MKKIYLEEINEKKKILETIKDNEYLDLVEKAATVMCDTINVGNKIFLAGNGGSAADAQHFAGEMVGRFMIERASIPAFSLCVDPSVMTCIGNDYGFEEVFARQLQGLGKEGDVFIGISTSGDSENIIKAIEEAKRKKMYVIGLLGKDGGRIKEMCDIPLVVPSNSTPRIQEIHTFTVHMLCETIEKNIFV